MLRLKKILKGKTIAQTGLAKACAVSDATVSQLLNHSSWPKSIPRTVLEPKIRAFLVREGVPEDVIATAFEEITPQELEQMVLDVANEKAPAGSRRQRPDAQPKNTKEPTEEDEVMLLRKQSLTPAAKRHFGLFRDPFGEVQSAEEVYASPDIRYVRESLVATAKHGGFMAVVGESGSGKSTIRRDLIERLGREGAMVQVIEPYIVGMEDNDMKGKTLRASHIVEAIMEQIAPLEKLPKSPEKRFQKVHAALRESSRAGYSHVLVIEEAHSIPIPTLKHLKRFFELEDGFKKLLGIVLIGQPELAQKLDERNPQVREVVQRCEMVILEPLGEHLRPYLDSRFTRAGKPLPDVMDEAAIEALRAKLTPHSGRPGQTSRSILYPLAVNNVVTAALNAAAEYGVPCITADLIKEV